MHGLSDEGDMPREAFTVFRKGLLVDVMRARAKARGQRPSPTYQAGAGAQTRIDGIFMDPKVAALVHEERVVPKPALPGHDVLRVSIALNMACQQVTKIRKTEDPQTATSRHKSSMTWRTCSRADCIARGEMLYVHRTQMPCGAPRPRRPKSFCH